jgi:hypothetical protein
MSEHPESDLRALRELPPVDVPGDVGDRVRRRALRELEEAAAPGGAGWAAIATRAWTRVGLPAALAVTVVVYLSWAVTSASAVYR